MPPPMTRDRGERQRRARRCASPRPSARRRPALRGRQGWRRLRSAARGRPAPVSSARQCAIVAGRSFSANASAWSIALSSALRIAAGADGGAPARAARACCRGCPCCARWRPSARRRRWRGSRSRRGCRCRSTGPGPRRWSSTARTARSRARPGSSPCAHARAHAAPSRNRAAPGCRRRGCGCCPA